MLYVQGVTRVEYGGGIENYFTTHYVVSWALTWCCLLWKGWKLIWGSLAVRDRPAKRLHADQSKMLKLESSSTPVLSHSFLSKARIRCSDTEECFWCAPQFCPWTNPFSCFCDVFLLLHVQVRCKSECDVQTDSVLLFPQHLNMKLCKMQTK